MGAGPVSPAARAPAGLDTPLQYLKGVGPQKARALERLGLLTVRDALNHFPRDYQDRREFVPFQKLALGETGVVEGTVFGVASPRRGSRAPVQVTFRDRIGYFTALWFGRAYLAQVFKRDQRVVLYGKKALAKDRRVVLEGPDFEIVAADERVSIHMGRVVPVYALTEGLFQRQVRELWHGIVAAYADQTPDILPVELRQRRDLLPAAAAYRTVHFPERVSDVDAARRRFAFEDFFVLQVGLTLRRARQAQERGRSLAPSGALVERLRQGLPFTLTAAQERVWTEIRADLARPVPMNRLLQGDVGSGKTIVAVMALLTAVEAGCQAVLMAPTEILAEQHLRTVRALGRAARPRGGLALRRPARAGARGRAGRSPEREGGHRRGHACPDPGRGGAPPARAGRRGRAAPLRRAPARVAARERGASPRARHDGDADPAHARPDALRRPRRLGPRRAAARPDADPYRVAT